MGAEWIKSEREIAETQAQTMGSLDIHGNIGVKFYCGTYTGYIAPCPKNFTLGFNYAI